MLCSACASITLSVGAKCTTVEIRRYSNLYELRSLAKECEFCDLLHEEAQKLEHPNEGGYCKQSWGIEFFNLLLEQSPVIATHRSQGPEHNVYISCYLDAQNTLGYPGGPISLDWRSVLGGVFVEPESEFASAVAGRTFTNQLSEEEQIGLGKALYDECRLKHDLCWNTLDRDFMPKRVLDLLPSASPAGTIRLLECPKGFKRPYATLSYCWGRAQNVRLTQDVRDYFLDEGLSLPDLPGTIGDACKLCVGIGIRYLWVCSLCIVQDSEIDWTEQSAAMASIYNCSELTISAASSQNCTDGVLVGRSSLPTSFATIAAKNLAGRRGSCYVRARLYPEGFTKEPTDFRGWTLQEILLSRRVLVHGTIQISWQCAKSYWSQSGTVLEPLPGMQGIFPCPLLKYPMNRYDDGKMDSDIQLNSILHVWQRVVWNYCRRNLSLSKDKLPAISGIAKWLSHRYLSNDTYVAGLWSSQLPKCLLWYNKLSFPADTDQANRPLTYRAPSWTWASQDSKCMEWLETTSEPTHSTVFDCKLWYKGSDTFGEVIAGYIKIQAPLKEGWLVPNGAYPETFDVWDGSWRAELTDLRPSPLNNSLGPAYLDVYEQTDLSLVGRVDREGRAKECTCIRVTAKAGLLVCRAADPDYTSADRVYRRIGLVTFGDRAETWWGSSSREIIRLI